MSEEIDGERHEYADTLWIPSATDVFGAGDWWNEEPDSFQLEIFKRERDRVKEHVGDGTWCWWLRSPYASNSYIFVIVYTGGTVGYGNANNSLASRPDFISTWGRPNNSSQSESSPYIKGEYNLSDGLAPSDKHIPRYG